MATGGLTGTGGIPMHQRRTGVSRNQVSSNGIASSGNQNGNNGSSMYGGRGYGDLEGGGGSRRGVGGRNAGWSSSSDANASIMEKQNNERISELSEHVARLKGLTIDIGNEVREQNNLLDTVGDGFGATNDMLQSSLRRIGHMMETTGGKHMCYLVAFSVFVMVFLWWLMSYAGSK